MNVNALFPGSTNDVFIWNRSSVANILRTLHERGHTNYYLLGKTTITVMSDDKLIVLGDSGYPLRTWLLTPLQNEPEPNTPEFRYNTRHRSIRSIIERCNGVLKMRFRCLLKHRVLHYAPAFASQIINACVVLHNICIENNIPEPQPIEHVEDFDFGLYNGDNNNVQNDNHCLNPELAAGRRLRNAVIRNL